MAALLFVINNLLAIVIAGCAADVVMARRETWRRALAVLAGYPVVILVVMLVLGTVGLLSAIAVATLLTAVAAVAVLVRWRFGGSAGPASPPTAPASPDGHAWHLGLIPLALLGGFGGLIVAATCYVPWFGMKWDDLSYHAPAAAQWLVDGRLSLAPFNYHVCFPLNAELISLWFLLPFRFDALANLTGLYWTALAVASVISLVRAQGNGGPAALLSAGLLLASPILAENAASFCAVDIAGPAAVLAAIAFAVPSAPGATRRGCLADALYSGLLCGLAVGCKVSFAPVGIILLAWFALGRRAGVTATRRTALVAVFALGAALTGVYWYARAAVLTGNPLFPAELGPLAGPFSAECQQRTKLITWILKTGTDASFWQHLLQVLYAWPLGLFLLSAVGYVAVAVALLRRLGRRMRARQAEDGGTQAPAPMAFTLLLLVGLTLLVLFPLMPFSGTPNSPTATLRVDPRFLIGPFAIGLVLLSALTGVRSTHRSMWLALAVLVTVTALPRGTKQVSWVFVAAGGLTVIIWHVFQPALLRAWRLRPFRLALLLVVLVALAVWAPRKHKLTGAAVRHFGGARHPVGRCWSLMEMLPKGANITWYGPAAYQYYALYGREYHLVPRPTNADGSPYRHLHERWIEDPEQVGWWTARGDPPVLSNLVPNLISAGIEYVFVTKWDRDEWPPQQAILARSPQAQVIYNEDGYNAIWRIVPRKAGAALSGPRGP